MSSSQGRLTRPIPPTSRPDAGQDAALCLTGVLDAGWSVTRRAVRAGVMPERVFAVADAIVAR
ncbi:hypothetical protein AB0H94_27540 [Streptomyces purpurascens]|uniref:hypothetical protein n=1 Tax=Streptomyces purpurascens TaxID=1924 RepID=UPI0033ED5FF7